jgi:hypothetical protein
MQFPDIENSLILQFLILKMVEANRVEPTSDGASALPEMVFQNNLLMFPDIKDCYFNPIFFILNLFLQAKIISNLAKLFYFSQYIFAFVVI